MISLEPQIYEFVGLKELEQEGDTSLVGGMAFSSDPAAFDYAANALNTILEELVRKSVLSFLHCDILAKPSTIFAQVLKRVADIGYTAVQVSGTCVYDAQWLKSLWNRKSLLRMTLFSPAKSFGNRPGNPGRLFSLCDRSLAISYKQAV